MRREKTLFWFWDSNEAGTEAWICDRNGFIILDGLTAGEAKVLVRNHNTAIRMAWANEEGAECL